MIYKQLLNYLITEFIEGRGEKILLGLSKGYFKVNILSRWEILMLITCPGDWGIS